MTTALIITAAGINCDRELAHAFQLAGAQVQAHHINTLITRPSLIDQFDLIGLPGGFSYGDAIAAGRIMAQLIRQHLYSALIRAVHERQVPVFAPCNGFQIAAQIGLLPGPMNDVSHDDESAWKTRAPAPTMALAQNVSGRFVNCWSRVEFPKSRCIWTQNLIGHGDALMLPSAHGEGRFVVDDPSLIERLQGSGQLAVQYHREDNFNGSTERIAGVCDATGLVFGLMPHPERFTHWTRHPQYKRLDPSMREHDPIGLQMFRNAVAFVEGRSSHSDEAASDDRMEEDADPGLQRISAAAPS